MSPILPRTLVVHNDASRAKSMIPISTISRLWRPAKEAEPSFPGLSKMLQHEKGSSKSKEQRSLSDEMNAAPQDTYPFVDEKGSYPSDLKRASPWAELKLYTDKAVLEEPKPVQNFSVTYTKPYAIAGKGPLALLSIPDEPIYLGEDFSALLKVPGIPNKDSIWIDLWIPIRAGDKVVPLDSQYLSSLTSFTGLRYLKISGMLKSYQKEIFRAVWKMEALEELDLRMAEEPQLSAGVYWRRIEKGWTPRRREPHDYHSPGNGKGRIARRFGVAEYLDNSVIELAKERHHDGLGDWEPWSNKKLSIMRLSLRGFVVDALPFYSCFDENRLRQITFTDCYDCGFCLPAELIDEVHISVGGDGLEPATLAPVHHIPHELKRITLRQGKIVEKHPVRSSHRQQRDSLRPKDEAAVTTRQYSPGKNPHRHVTVGGQPNDLAGDRLSLFSWRRRKHDFYSVIEEEEEEEED